MEEQTFRETVLVSLTEIKDALKRNDEDHAEMMPLVKKIPAMELGLNNHLQSHYNIKLYVFYPILAASILGIGGLFCRLVLKVF